ncbi:hypothetical protein QBC36DRAFT_292194 [Triangularia setosa]|uniref:Uncharacterized protein n=1 Tax=Triangularia setosa TaxID=2587417 RepID=A0AAN6W6X9_9PEZI|nr:hypothetical protein QBC36DRAFT_292194 [Podospora setosa]
MCWLVWAGGRLVGLSPEGPYYKMLGDGGRDLGSSSGFDTFRLVNVAAVLNDSGIHDDNADGIVEPDRRLKDSGLWYPRAPPDDIKLNGDFCPIKSFLSGFEPISERLVVEYNRGEIPEKCRKFGRGRVPEPYYRKTIGFAINGPGGERIVAVNIRQKHSIYREATHYTEEVLASPEICTNHGRSCYFAINDEHDRDYIVAFKESRFSVKHGMPITGFYGAQNYQSNLAALGVMTESDLVKTYRLSFEAHQLQFKVHPAH